MKELRWGIVGCGDVVEKKSGPSILAGARSRIVAAMRRDQEQLKAFAEAFGVPHCTANAEEIYHSPEVDIVYVATPPHLHREQVLAAAQAGKHVLVEKPMGMSAAESREMVQACQQTGVELFVAYYRRFQPHVVKMRELIRDGIIGDLIHAQVEFAMPYQPGRDWGWRTQPEISGGGLFADLLSHRIDLLVSFLGEPESIYGVRRQVHPDSRPEDLASLALQFTSGAQATVVGNFAAAKHLDRFVLTGTKGEIQTNYLDGHQFQVVANGECETMSPSPYPAPHTGLVRHIERVLAREEANATSGQSGMQTDRVLDIGVRQA